MYTILKHKHINGLNLSYIANIKLEDKLVISQIKYCRTIINFQFFIININTFNINTFILIN